MADSEGSSSGKEQPKASTPDAGDPGDAAQAFLTAAETGLKQAQSGEPDPNVSIAFALGWQMAELYRPDSRGAGHPADGADLPGRSRLNADELATVAVQQLQSGVSRLTKAITDAGLTPPDVTAFAQKLAAASSDRKTTIRTFHVELLGELMAADFRLGKAYGLGRALADTTRSPKSPAAELGRYRVATVASWIRDLATALPPHAAHPVASSLTAWSNLYDGKDDSQVDTAIKRKLPAQGRLWRSLLSGEKRGVDMLETSDYLSAGEGMLVRSLTLAWTFLERYWWIAMIVVLLFALGVGLIVAGGAAAVGIGASSVLASLGLTWKGVGTSLGTAAARIEQPLWEAQLDTVIYNRITPDDVLKVQPAHATDGDEPSLHVVAPPADGSSEGESQDDPRPDQPTLPHPPTEPTEGN